MTAWAVVLACLLFCEAGRAAEDELPSSDPAYARLAALAQAGFLPGKNARDFQGRTALTRSGAAGLISNLLDAWETRKDGWTPSQIDDLNALIAEFAFELKEIGEIRSPQPQREMKRIDSRPVPSDSWAMKDLSDLAAAGLADGFTEASFSGGRLFAREEIATIAAAANEKLARSPEAYSAEIKEKARRLAETFPLQPESTRNLPETATQKERQGPIGRIKGSSAIRTSSQKGEKTDFNDRITLEAVGANLTLYLLGELDNVGESGANVDFGETVKLNFTRKYATWRDSYGAQGLEYSLQLGEINNLEFARGLALGSANIVGFFGEAELSRRFGFSLGAGRDGDGGDVTAFRFEGKTGKNISFGANYVFAEAVPGDRTDIAGGDLEFAWRSYRFESEIASKASGGHAGFYRAVRDVGDGLRFVYERRNYRSYIVKNNNAPFYSGISGGDDENERGHYLGAEWEINKNLGLNVARDLAYRFDDGSRLADGFARLQIKTNFGLAVDVSHEDESNDADDSHRRIFSLNGSQKLRKNWTLSTGYKRDYDPQNLTKTLRFRLRLPVVKNVSTLTISETIRQTIADRKRTFQTLYNSKVGARFDASVGLNIQTGKPNRYDASLIWKF